MTTNPDTWTTRDLPVLRAVARLLDEGGPIYDESAVEAATGLSHRDTVRALTVLNGPYLDVELLAGGARYNVLSIKPDGLVAVGQWPSPEVAVDRMIQALEEMIDNTPEGSPKQSRLKASLAWIRDTGRDVMVEVAGAAITGRLPT